MSSKSNFAKQTWFLVVALLLITVPFWWSMSNTYVSNPVLIFWCSFVMLIPIATAFLLVIRRRLNNDENIIWVSKAMRILMHLIILVFLAMFIDSIYTVYDLGLNIMKQAVYDMPLYILSNFITNILIISLLCFSIRYNRLMCSLNHF